MDFTLKIYNTLLSSLQRAGYNFKTFADFIADRGEKTIILRHDVDRLPENSLVFAKIEHEKRIRGTYYFRAVKESWNEEIIRQIADLGHEIGYHYEDFVFARQKTKVKRQKEESINEKFPSWEGPDSYREGVRLRGLSTRPQDRTTARPQDNGRIEEELAKIAIESFRKNLEKLRSLAPVSTICMHGSPLSKWDSRLLWKYYDYRDFGITGEPYFDIDFNNVLYLTDTGRMWDGGRFSVRDKVEAEAEVEVEEKERYERREESVEIVYVHPTPDARRPTPFFHSTSAIIKAAETNSLPDKIMITFHPQRWTDRPVPWVKELVFQNVKNGLKYFIINMRQQA